MPRRTPSLLDILLLKPWWLSTAIGLGLFVLSSVLVGSLANSGNPFTRGFAHAGWIIPVGILVLFSFISAGAAFMGHRHRALVNGQTSIESIRNLGWSSFESLVAEAFRRQGYRVEQTLKGGSDGGVDLVLHKNGETTLVQCKQWRTCSVGAPVIRELFGVQTHEHAHKAIVITSGKFTREATEFANGKAIELIDGDALLRMVRQVQANPPPTLSAPEKSTVPLCPVCSSAMVERVARRGANAGNSFWGCPRYPRCNGTRPI